MILSDLGAEVVKVERPGIGDDTREWDPPAAGGDATYFLSVNRDKKSITIDLATPDGRDVATNLMASADVVVENFRSGVMDRLGLGYEAVRAANPSAVYCSISGFGRTGPNVGLPASDSLMQPYGGLMSVVGEPGRPPLKVGNIVSDMVAGTNAFAAVLMALFQRTTTGEGQRVEVALLDSIVAFQAAGLTQYLMTGRAPERLGNRHPLLATSGVIEASDGYVTFAILDHHWPAFCDAVKVDELTTDPRFATSQDRLDNRDALWAVFEQIFGEQTVAHWISTLNAIDIVCGPVNDYPAVVADAQSVHNGLFDECTNGTGATMPMVRSPMRIGEEPAVYSAPPTLGEHSRVVLSTVLGMSDGEIDRLIDAGAVVASS
jgi:crotonobetainyl-CoA:carnitine CoA-transferase CaiB-like acyl-CoA transferase